MFEPSVLGTQEYWDEFYQKEIDIMKLNHEECGEVWFGEQTQQTTIEFLLEKYTQFTCIDIGCGNGLFCIELLLQQSDEHSIHCIGLDYSSQSIDLAKMVHSKYDSISNIEWKCLNFLECDVSSLLKDEKVIVFHDKGTFDAISLHENKEQYKQMYKSQISKAIEYGKEHDQHIALFITSCNYASDELKKEFDFLSIVEEIEYPVFEFGGSKGSSVVSILFSK